MSTFTQESLSKALSVYFIMGSEDCVLPAKETLLLAIEGGASIFQYREKGNTPLSGAKRQKLARELQEICRKNKVPFIVNDDVALARDLNADGIHIGQDDAELRNVRKQFPDKIIGVSAHTMPEAEKAITGGADYLGIGPIYATTTKKDTKEVRGTILIEEIRAKGYSIPLVGIGGIKAGLAGKVILAGADGVSVISAISKAPFPLKAAQAIKKEVAGLRKL